MLRSESPSSKCAKLHTVATSNNRGFTLCDRSLIACLHQIYMVVGIRAHPVRGESHIQRNANGEVATLVLHYRVNQSALIPIRRPAASSVYHVYVTHCLCYHEYIIFM